MKFKFLVSCLFCLFVFFGAAKAQRSTITPEYAFSPPLVCNSNLKAGALVYVKNDGLYKCVNNVVKPVEGATGGGGGGTGTNRSKEIQLYTSLSAAQSDVSSGGAAADNLLTISTPTNCSSVLNFANTTSLEFTGTGKIVWQPGCKLTISGGIQAAKKQIFSGFTRDSLFLSANVDEYYPEWFGAKGDGVTDDFPAIQLMFDAVNYGSVPSDGQNAPAGGRFRFSTKGYNHSQELRINKPVEINGAGGSYRNNYQVVLNHPVNSPGLVFEDASQPRQYNVSTVSGSPNVVSLNSRFSQIDVGRPVSVNGAGAVSGGFPTDLNGTITAVTDQTHITLSVPAGITMNDTGIFMVATNGTTGAKGSILRGIAINAGGGAEGSNLTISTTAQTLTANGYPLGRISVTGTNGNGKQLYNADPRYLNAASHRGFPEGTVIGIGATRWILNYYSTTDPAIDEVPYITTRFTGQTFSNQSILNSYSEDIEPWMIGSRVKINGRYYTIGQIIGQMNGIGASRQVVLYYAAQFDNQPPPQGAVGTPVTTLPEWSGTVEVVSPPARTNLAAHAFVRHGVEAQVSMTIENCYIHGSYGSNISMDSFIVTDGAENNINYARVARNFLYDAQGHGLFVRGKNSNVIEVEANDSSQNEGWAYYDASGLGNTYHANHANVSKLGAYYSDTNRNVNQSTYTANYAESGSPCNIIAPTAAWFGGLPGNGFCPQENQAAVLQGSVNASKLMTLTGGMRAVNEQPITTDGNNNVFSDLLPSVNAQIGSDNGQPLMLGFGAADDGVNRPGQGGFGTAPNYSWGYSKFSSYPGWYIFGYQYKFGGLTTPAQTLMAVSGTNTVLGAGGGDYSGSYRLWFPNGMYFGQKSVTANGKTANDPAFNLSANSDGLVISDGSLAASGFRNTPMTLAKRPPCVAGSVGLEVVILGSTAAPVGADVKQTCLGNAVDPRTYSWKTFTTN